MMKRVGETSPLHKEECVNSLLCRKCISLMTNTLTAMVFYSQKMFWMQESLIPGIRRGLDLQLKEITFTSLRLPATGYVLLLAAAAVY